MEQFGVTDNEGKVLKRLVGAWGFEPQSPTVSKQCFTLTEAE